MVVAFACAAVGDRFAAFFLGDFDLTTGNDGTGKRCTEEVYAFVNGITLDSGENQFLDEFFAEILELEKWGREDYLDVYGDSADFKSLLLCGFEILFLSNIGHYHQLPSKI